MVKDDIHINEKHSADTAGCKLQKWFTFFFPHWNRGMTGLICAQVEQFQLKHITFLKAKQKRKSLHDILEILNIFRLQTRLTEKSHVFPVFFVDVILFHY